MDQESLIDLNLLVYALVFVVISVVRAALRLLTEKVAHLVLIEAQSAGVIVDILVVYVELAALAVGRTLRRVFGKIKRHFYDLIIATRKRMNKPTINTILIIIVILLILF